MLHYLIKIRTLGDRLIYSLLIVLGSLFVALLINCRRFCSLQRCTHNSVCLFTSPSCLSRDQRQTQTHLSCLQNGSFHSNAREDASLLSSAVDVQYQGSPPLDSASSIFDISHLEVSDAIQSLCKGLSGGKLPSYEFSENGCATIM